MYKVYTQYGVAIALVLIAYFVLAKLLGLHQYPVFSALNGVIYGGGLLLAMKAMKRSSTNFKYAEGFQVGIMSGGVATILFTAFMAVYCYQINTEFASRILESWSVNYNSGTLVILFSVFLMGLSTSVVLSLAFMQLLKVSWNTSKSPLNAS